VFRSLAALVAGALICAPAAAETGERAKAEEALKARLVAVGTWEFSATKRGSNGQPECFESWTFNADGTGLIVSGKQRVTMRWLVAHHAGIGQFVFLANVSTTDGPDCMGRAVDKGQYPLGQPGFELLFYGAGAGALVCMEAREIRRPDGSRFKALEPEDCWGRIVPAATN
jgi:hypothetical protein